MRTTPALPGAKPDAQLPRFKVEPKACGFQSGVDVLHLNRLNDELETTELQRKLKLVPSWTNPLQ